MSAVCNGEHVMNVTGNVGTVLGRVWCNHPRVCVYVYTQLRCDRIDKFSRFNKLLAMPRALFDHGIIYILYSA